MMTEAGIINKYLPMAYHPDIFNCWTLVKRVYADLDSPLTDVEDFALSLPVSEAGSLLEKYHSVMRQVNSPGQFDLVLMDVGGKLHAGVVLSKGRFIHTSRAGTGVCRLGHPRWSKHILGYYRQVRS